MKRKITLAIVVAAFVGAALWMRQIASWRPQVVARLGFKPTGMQLSRDGRRLLITGRVPSSMLWDFKSVILDPQTQTITSDPHQVHDFWKNTSLPRLSLNKSQTQLIFTRAPGKSVILEGKIHPQFFDFDASGEGASNFAWSNARGEVYRENNGEIRIWDWNTGRLKNRHSHWKDGSYQSGDFSPDGQSLLSFNRSPQGINSLIRYDVPSGRQTAIIYRDNLAISRAWGGYGWSPDNRFLWFVRNNPSQEFGFNVVRAADSKLVWSAPCASSSRWLPDGRIGLVQKDGFSWRDATGREIGHLLGPLPGATAPLYGGLDWQASPDGNWIYSTDGKSGLIRRWRAK